MPSLQIYDTKGNEYSPDGGTGRTNERIKELFYAGVRFAVESVGEIRITAFFRARDNRDARSEQFYAEYTARNASNPIDEFESALRRRVESEWGYAIDDASEEMSVFRAITRNDSTLPGSDQDRQVLRKMVGSGPIANVGVRDANDAVGLIQDVSSACSRAAITDSANTDSLSEFDVAIVTGGHAGIKPLGATEERWERTANSLRKQFIDEEVGRIEDAVQSLSRDHGLSSSEIRDRVTRRVPALKQPSTGGSTSSLSGSSSLGSKDSKLPSAAVGKYVAIAALVLLVLIGGVFGASVLGFGPLAGDDDTISGTVLDGEDGDGVEGATVVLLNDGENRNETETDDDGNFAFNGLEDGNYTLQVEADAHQYEQKVDISPGQDVEFMPNEAETRSVSGTVVDADDDSTIEDASVELLDADGEVVDEAEGGEFGFEIDDPDAEYTVQASADGYEEGTEEAIVGESITIELAEGLTALSGTGRDTGDGEPIEEATVTAENDAGETVSFETDDGTYELELARGEYEVTAEADGYEPVTETITLDAGEASREFELAEQALWTGVVRDDDDETEINGASVELYIDDEKIDEKSDLGAENFRFEELAPGEYTVEVERSGHEDREFSIEFEPGEEREEDIRLDPN